MVEASPKVVAILACQSAVPNGCCRFTQVRRVVSSCSKRGVSIHDSQSGGAAMRSGPVRFGKRRLDQPRTDRITEHVAEDREEMGILTHWNPKVMARSIAQRMEKRY